MYRRINEKGDTLIEVMLAMTLLTAILFISWGVVNRASQISIAARQRTVMVNAMKEQAEIIKSKYPTNPNASIADKRFSVQSSATISDIPCDDTKDDDISNGKIPDYSFYFEPADATIKDNAVRTVPTFNDSKVWVQLKQVGTDGNGYIDFYIRGCWLTSGVQREDNSQFVVRLNI